MRRNVVPRLLLSMALLMSMAASAGFAQKKSLPLTIEGDTVVVVKSLPFKVNAASGAQVYIWSVPDALTATSDENVLTVTKAPKGTYKVSVVSLTIDFDTKKVVKERGEIQVSVGTLPPGPGPEPDPDPVPPADPLLDALQKAYDGLSESDKSANLPMLAAVYRGGSKLVKGGSVTSAGALFKAMTAGEDAAKLKGKLGTLKAVCADKEPDGHPSKSDVKIDDSNREKIAASLERCAAALEKVKK